MKKFRNFFHRHSEAKGRRISILLRSFASLRMTKINGQVIMEFTFCMIIVMLMIFSTMMIFRWVGLDLAERRMAHDEALTQDVPASPEYSYAQRSQGPMIQLQSRFYKPIKMNAVWDGF